MSEMCLVHYSADDGSVIRHERLTQTCVARFEPAIAFAVADTLNAEVERAAETFRIAMKEAVDRL